MRRDQVLDPRFRRQARRLSGEVVREKSHRCPLSRRIIKREGSKPWQRRKKEEDGEAGSRKVTTLARASHWGRPPHHRSPATAIEPAGQDLGAPLAPANCRQYRSNRSGLPVISRQCRCAVWRRLIAGSRRTATPYNGSGAGSGSPRRGLLLRPRLQCWAVTETGSI
jgi:hypothetical protein